MMHSILGGGWDTGSEKNRLHGSITTRRPEWSTERTLRFYFVVLPAEYLEVVIEPSFIAYGFRNFALGAMWMRAGLGPTEKAVA